MPDNPVERLPRNDLRVRSASWVTVLVDIDQVTRFPQGVTASGTGNPSSTVLDFESNTVLASYNPGAGPFDPLSPSNNAEAHVVGDLELSASAYIHGDATATGTLDGSTMSVLGNLTENAAAPDVGDIDDMVIFSFNVRGHGNSQDDVPGRPQDYWIRGLDDKQDYYYRGAYMDCLQALEYLMSRREVDPKRVAVWGGSQGGGFSFVTAALDERPSLCVSDIPFLADWVNYFKLTTWPEMDAWIEAKPERTLATTLRTLSYFDTLNMASQIRCRVLMRTGLQDNVCPPTTNFAVFNRISGPAEYVVYAQAGHGLGRGNQTHGWDWIRKNFGLK